MSTQSITCDLIFRLTDHQFRYKHFTVLNHKSIVKVFLGPLNRLAEIGSLLLDQSWCLSRMKQ